MKKRYFLMFGLLLICSLGRAMNLNFSLKKPVTEILTSRMVMSAYIYANSKNIDQIKRSVLENIVPYIHQYNIDAPFKDINNPVTLKKYAPEIVNKIVNDASYFYATNSTLIYGEDVSFPILNLNDNSYKFPIQSVFSFNPKYSYHILKSNIGLSLTLNGVGVGATITYKYSDEEIKKDNIKTSSDGCILFYLTLEKPSLFPANNKITASVIKNKLYASSCDEAYKQIKL